MENTILFETEKRTFHLWPFDYYSLRGFFSKSHVVVTEEDIKVEFKGVFKHTFRLDELEFCNVKERWFGYANAQLSVGVNDGEWQKSKKYKKEYEKLLKRERENEENKDEASDTDNEKCSGWQGRRFYYKDGRCYFNDTLI